MIEEITRAEAAASERLSGAATLEHLREAETDALGRRSRLASLKKQLGALPPEERRQAGQALNGAMARVQRLADARRGELEQRERDRRAEKERLDLTEVIPGLARGHIHLVTQARDQLEDVFVGFGFTVSEGPEAESDWYNFEALNMPPLHPARGMWDTLYLDLGEPESVLLRTHTSPVQIRIMEQQPPPIYTVMPGRVYRRDTPDASHLAVFHQIEGLVVDRGITFGDLAGTLNAFTHTFFGAEISARLRPSYFPFTEPSAEFDITCVFCKGEGCRTCGGTGFVELGGCGMVHPNVFRAVGYDPDEWTGFAFGFGIDRLAATRHGIGDLRELTSVDIRFLRQF